MYYVLWVRKNKAYGVYVMVDTSQQFKAARYSLQFQKSNQVGGKKGTVEYANLSQFRLGS